MGLTKGVPPQRRQCTATIHRTGQRCIRAPIAGGTVCYVHGGAAPQVKAKAHERLLALVDPALAELERLLRKSKMDPVRLAAVKDILDRCGYKPSDHVELTGKGGGALTVQLLDSIVNGTHETANESGARDDTEPGDVLAEVASG